jgi:hypothetical protein
MTPARCSTLGGEEMPEDLVGAYVLEPDEVAPLLGALTDSFAEVRISAFEALTRLPLAPADWVKVGDYVEWVLDRGLSLEEKIAVVGGAPWIPVRSVRERVARLAEEGTGEVREEAAMAVASFGEPSTAEPPAAEPLLTDIDGPEADRLVAVQRLAMVGASGKSLDELRRRCHSVPKDDPVRPWLALVLARSGEDEELKAFFGDVLRGEAAWYVRWDQRALWFLANSPLPAKTVQWLTLLPQAGTWGVEPGEAATALVWFSTTPPGFTTASASELADARDLLLRFGVLSDDEWPPGEALASVREAMAAALEGGLATAAVTVLSDKVRQWRWMLGNEIVQGVQRIQTQFRPDLEGLFAAYQRQAEEIFAWYSREADDGRLPLWTFGTDDEGGPRSMCYQIAWTVSRGGLRGLVPGLAAHLTAKNRAERIAAVGLIADAADYVLRPYGPMFGGGAAPERRLAPQVLVDDSAPRYPETSAVDEAREGDRVECSVFAPAAVSPGSTFLIQAFAHIASQAHIAARRAMEFDADSVRRAVKTLEYAVSRGTKLVFGLTMPGLRVDDPAQSMVWLGTTESVQFGVSIPKRYPPGNVVGTITICQDWMPIGHIKFILEVTASPAAGHERPHRPISVTGECARRYEMAFVSYASEDRTKVLERIQVLSAVGVRTFQDILGLEPGERWERSLYRHIDESDIVLLFWSNAAKQSKWVRREVLYALDRKHGDECAPPEIGPIIIEGPPVPRPWKELKHLHFNDLRIYLMDR